MREKQSSEQGACLPERGCSPGTQFRQGCDNDFYMQGFPGGGKLGNGVTLHLFEKTT